jgi:hypothetical protein
MGKYKRFCVTSETLIQGTAVLTSGAEKNEAHIAYLLRLSSARYEVVTESFVFQVATKNLMIRRDEVTGEWRRLHNELNDLYSSPNIVRVIKSRRIRRAGDVARMGERRGVYRDLVGKPEGKRPHGRSRHRCRIILTWIFRKWDVGAWMDRAGLG